MTSEAAGRILAKIEATWRPLREAAERLDAARLEESTPAGWTAKEMLAHVAFWEEAAFGWVTLGLRGLPLPEGWSFGSGYYPELAWPRADVHNAREAEWARSQTTGEVMARWDRSHEQLLAIMGSVTDAEKEEHSDYFDQIGDHYVEHLSELEALIGDKAEPEASRWSG